MALKIKNNKIYGYIRVSTKEQNLETQKLQIEKFAIQNNLIINKIVEEHVSGSIPLSKRLLGPTLEKLLPGDTIIFTEMSRFGRNSGELVNQLQIFIKKNIHFIFIKENLNTKNKNNKLITNLLISIFSGIYQFEKELLIERTKEGMYRAKLEGKHVGRPKGSTNKTLKLDLNYNEIKEYKEMGLSNTTMSKIFKVHPKTIKRFLIQRNLI
jgi:putative DNA-invertase from lambdoid prophage Rac